MKKIFIIAALLAVSVAGTANAQEEGYIELLRSDIRTGKIAIVTEVMQLQGEQSEAFWPIYKEYDHEMSKLTDMRLATIKDYAENYEKMTDEKARELIASSFEWMEKRLALRKAYFVKFQEALPAATAAKFIHLDHQISLFIDLQVAANIPLIEPMVESLKTEGGAK